MNAISTPLSDLTADTVIENLTAQIGRIEALEHRICAYDRAPRWTKILKGGSGYRRRLAKKLARLKYEYVYWLKW